jgi:hypothetical protein
MDVFFIKVIRGNSYIDFFDNIFISGLESIERFFIILAGRISKWYLTRLWGIKCPLCCTLDLWGHANAINFLLKLLSLLSLPSNRQLEFGNNV